MYGIYLRLVLWNQCGIFRSEPIEFKWSQLWPKCVAINQASKLTLMLPPRGSQGSDTMPQRFDVTMPRLPQRCVACCALNSIPWLHHYHLHHYHGSELCASITHGIFKWQSPAPDAPLPFPTPSQKLWHVLCCKMQNKQPFATLTKLIV